MKATEDRRTTVVYVAGPYRASHGRTVADNIEWARRLAEALWQDGYTAICPHLNTSHFDGLCPDGEFLRGDLEILRRCDAVCVVERWEQSAGARGEVAEARAHDIPVCRLVAGELVEIETEDERSATG